MPTGFFGNTPSTQDVYRMSGDTTQKTMEGLEGLNNPFAAYNTLGSATTAFGLPTDVSAAFNPGRQNIARQRARSMQSAALRNGNSATPNRAFSGVEGSFADSLGNLEGQASQAQLQQQNQNAAFFKSLLGDSASWDMNRAKTVEGMSNDLFQNAQNFQQGQFNMRDPGVGDYLMSALGSLGGGVTQGFGAKLAKSA